MTHGKPWDINEVGQLHKLLEEGKSIDEICTILVKTRDGVLSKMYSLGLKQKLKEDNGKMHRLLASSFSLPSELPNVEDVLKRLAAALSVLETPGLDRAETLRLRTFILGSKAYERIFGEYMDYRGLEKRLIELEGKYAELSRNKKS